ncbi:MAG: IS110 family RNA-guided transposase [Pirellulales bacterium]
MTATRTNDCTQTQTVLHLALELGDAKWKLAFTTGLGRKPRQRDIPARETAVLWQEIQAAKQRFDLPADAPVVSCYEAGRDGFWLHRWLVSRGVKNEIVDSSSIHVDRRVRRAKTDRLDAEKLLKMLVRWTLGEEDVWRVVRVPSVAEEDARQLHRELETLRREQTSHRNRIRGLLISQGLAIPVSRFFPKELSEARLWDGQPLPADLHRRLLREFTRLQGVNRQIRELEQQRAQRIRKQDKDAAVGQVRQLMQLRGIADNSAWLYVFEVFAWRQIKNRRQLGSIVGLTGSPYCSGNLNHEQGISKAGNRRMRAMAIEIAWGWLRYQPKSELSRWYDKQFAHQGKRMRRIGIVAVARKLLVALWKYLETGEPPAGAELTDWQSKIHYTLALSVEEA